MSVELFANLVEASQEPINLTFGKHDFTFATEPTELILTAVDPLGESVEHRVARVSSLFHLCMLIGDATRVEHPELGVASVVGPVGTHRAIKDIITNGPDYKPNAAYADLVGRLKECNGERVVIVDDLYSCSVRYANEMTSVQVTKPRAYCNTAHFGRATCISDIVDYIVGEYEQLNDVPNISAVKIEEALTSI